MNISFEEIGRLTVTFARENCGSGQVCKLGGNGIVAACAENDRFCGVVEGVRGNYAAVQVEGFATVKFSGSMSVGYVNLCADGNGGVKAGQGREYLVVSVDEAAGTAVMKL